MILNKIKGYRTLAFNIISAIIVIATAATGTITDPKWLASIATIITVGNVLLRFLTDTPIGKSS
jgi:hypothetical protein